MDGMFEKLKKLNFRIQPQQKRNAYSWYELNLKGWMGTALLGPGGWRISEIRRLTGATLRLYDLDMDTYTQRVSIRHDSLTKVQFAIKLITLVINVYTRRSIPQNLHTIQKALEYYEENENVSF